MYENALDLLREVREMTAAQQATLDALHEKIDRHVEHDSKAFDKIFELQHKNSASINRMRGVASTLALLWTAVVGWIGFKGLG